MSRPAETSQLPIAPKKWLAAVVITGLTISIAAGLSTYLYGNVLGWMMDFPAVRWMMVGAIVIALAAAILRLLATLFLRWRGKAVQRPEPGAWSLVWVSFQLACLVAMVTLGVVGLIAAIIGHPEGMGQGFMLVLVASGLLYLIGGAVRETSRMVRIIRN